eukprot:8270317-Pyramimonas_sp.AAC.2
MPEEDDDVETVTPHPPAKPREDSRRSDPHRASHESSLLGRPKPRPSAGVRNSLPSLPTTVGTPNGNRFSTSRQATN